MSCTIESILELAKHVLKERDVPFVQQAYTIAYEKLPLEESEKLLQIAELAVSQIGLGGKALTSIFLKPVLEQNFISSDFITLNFGEKVLGILNGLNKVSTIDTTKSKLHSENFIKLILSQADDVRVILILLTEKMYTLFTIENLSQDKQILFCEELSALYAPLAHRLGLYSIKTQMEEMSMKYRHNATYKSIAKKLAEKKTIRDAYIAKFIDPIKKELEAKNISFEIKGRPKSIYSIWNKIRNSNTAFENIYDLFAIRIIINSTSLETEKPDCWNVYSIVSDIYRPNPNRLRDWISSPKTSGYESLHTTVLGPENKWVEVQIRTQRMDEIAEKGHAAHWRYKEGASAVGSVSWLASIREILENPNPEGLEEDKNSRMELYTNEIFVFTPQGDLRKLSAKATVLDFAYEIHSNVGNTCTAGIVNGKVEPLKYVLQNGDRIEILTSKTQKPKQDWLSFVVTSKARGRIKKYLTDIVYKDAEQGKEILQRKLSNIKVRFADDNIHRLIKHFNFKHANELYLAVAQNKIDFSEVKQLYSDKIKPDTEKKPVAINADDFKEKVERNIYADSDDLLIIDNNIDKVDYKLASCCNPIKGDNIFGFISANGGIKIHRINCPNAHNMLSKYPYRIIKSKWTQTNSTHEFAVGIRIIGNDEISIVSNVTQLLSKDIQVNIRGFNISSKDGNFEGLLSLLIQDISKLDKILDKIKAVKGVHTAERFDSYR